MNLVGYVKLHRQSMDSTVWDNDSFWKVWCWCLMRANHTETKVHFNSEDIPLSPGQFISSHDSAIREIRNITVRGFRTAIKYLKSTNRVTSHSTPKYTVFTVVNWGDYQSNDKVSDKQVTSPRQGSDKGVTTDKNEEELNKNEKESNITPKSEFAPFVFLTEGEHAKYTNQFGDEYIKRCCEKLSAWIEQDPTPKRKRNGKNASATFRAWVFNAVSEEQTRASRLNGNHKPKSNQIMEDNMQVVADLLEEIKHDA